MNPTTTERLFAEFPPTTDAEWRKAAEESLHGAPFEKRLVTRTPEGIDLQPIYTRADLEKLSLGESWPGLAPYVRGADPLGARAAGWLICQEVLAARYYRRDSERESGADGIRATMGFVPRSARR